MKRKLDPFEIEVVNNNSINPIDQCLKMGTLVAYKNQEIRKFWNDCVLKFKKSSCSSCHTILKKERIISKNSTIDKNIDIIIKR